MATITDEYMRQMLSDSRSYSLVILKATAKRSQPGADQIIWEHGRRNFSLRADGLLSIVCPLTDEGEVRGVSIFNASLEETKKIMEEDPAVKAGVLTYEIRTCLGFPGDSLPAKEIE